MNEQTLVVTSNVTAWGTLLASFYDVALPALQVLALLVAIVSGFLAIRAHFLKKK